MITKQHEGQKVFQANPYSVGEVTVILMGAVEWSAFATVEHPAVRGTLLRAHRTVERLETLFPTSDEAYAAMKASLDEYDRKQAAIRGQRAAG